MPSSRDTVGVVEVRATSRFRGIATTRRPEQAALLASLFAHAAAILGLVPLTPVRAVGIERPSPPRIEQVEVAMEEKPPVFAPPPLGGIQSEPPREDGRTAPRAPKSLPNESPGAGTHEASPREPPSEGTHARPLTPAAPDAPTESPEPETPASTPSILAASTGNDSTRQWMGSGARARGSGTGPVQTRSGGSGARPERGSTVAGAGVPWGSIRAAIQRHVVYPAQGRQRGWEGRVLIRFRLAPSGKVVDVRVVRSSGYSALDESALAAVSHAEPLPQSERGVDVVMPIEFRLE